MRIALAQLNPIVGDIAGNMQQFLDAIDRAREQDADVLIGAELGLIGYPPRDLLLREGVIDSCDQAVETIAAASGAMTVLVGHPRRIRDRAGRPSDRLANSYSVCRDGRVIETYDKRLLPGYDVFDEDRYFDAGTTPGLVKVNGRPAGLLLCEDLWRGRDNDACRQYPPDPPSDCVAGGAEVLLAGNASPFVTGKWRRHVEHITAIAKDLGVSIAAVNQVGANDDLIFDGRSIVVSHRGEILLETPAWRSGVYVVDLPELSASASSPQSVNGKHSVASPGHEGGAASVDETADLFNALSLGVRDYFAKTGHQNAIIGLSGGIDSAVVAAIAASALGAKHVIGVLMPSRHSSSGSETDARALAANLGLADPHVLPIRDLHDAALQHVHDTIGDVESTLTDENIQARLRGVLLMAVSNATGGLVLSTSNKSEMAVGYSTLYGDMVGAVAVIADLLKGEVYRVAEWINAHHDRLGFAVPPIPRASIEKPPSAELRPGQTDQDTLPPYDDLDVIVRRRLDLEQSVERIAAETGLDTSVVEETCRQIDRSEFKRLQAAVVLKTAPRTFGPGRPMPVVMKQTAMPAPATASSSNTG